MRSFVHRIASVATILGGLSIKEQHALIGKEAKDLTDTEAARIHSRLMRDGGQALDVGAIVERSAQRRRARQTHPGKRGKRVSL